MTHPEGREFSFEFEIQRHARAAGLELAGRSVAALAAHARLVLRENAILHLTSIVDPGLFVDRHLREAFEGANLLDASASGVLLDLGSGNGYPGIPLAIARPDLRAVLAESGTKKAVFLRRALDAAGLETGSVLRASVQRAADLERVGPVDVLTTRAMGGWERIVPRLARAIRPSGVVLIWAGADAPAIFERRSWSRLRLADSRAIPGRVSASIYRLDVKVY